MQALAIADDNRDGWISIDEAKGKRCVIDNRLRGTRRSTTARSTTRTATASPT